VNRLPAAIEDSAEPEPIARRLVAARLIGLIKLLHRSASPAYRSETRLSDFEWRVMTQVGDHGPLVLTSLATLLQQDKGQVSHAVKSLIDARLLSREHLRAPIALTKSGRSLFDRIVKLGRSRNAVLVRELSDTERRAVPSLLLKLKANARALLRQAQVSKQQSPESGDDEPGAPPSLEAAPGNQPPRKPSTLEPRLVAQELFALHGLLQRSAAFTFRRELQLSDFEWRVLAQVGEHAPLTLIQLMPLLSRDKSQVGRTLARLEERGLVTREKIGGGRHVLVGISERGREIYAQLTELALERNTALLVGLNARDQQTLMSILDKLEAGATALLDRS
jgi:DNA-binding MarR family transcriptional regulator